MAKNKFVRGLKNTFVPHARNKYKPHITKHYGLAVILVSLLFVQALYNYSITGHVQVLGYATNVSQGALLTYTNQNRAASGLSGLTLNGALNSAAQAKANHMIANNYWSHYAPDGTTPWSFMDSAGYSYIKAGENLAYGFTDSAGTVQGWMNSPPHAANILDSAFTEVGFGIADGANFQGDENTVIVAMYGQPLASAPVAEEPAPAAPAPESEIIAQEEPTPAPEESPSKPKPKEANDSNSPDDTQTDGQLAWTHKDLLELNEEVLSVESFAISPEQQARTTLFGAIFSGQANWGIYLSFGLLSALTLAYIIRHSVAIYQFAVKGEHYVEGHPFLEAGLIYGLLWLALVSTYGVVG